MQSSLKLLALSALVTSATTGCANYDKVAELQARNLELLGEIESRLTVKPEVNEQIAQRLARDPTYKGAAAERTRVENRDPSANWLRQRLDSARAYPLMVAMDRAAFAKAVYAAAVAKPGASAEDKKLAEKAYSDALARIQDQLYQEEDDEVVRAERTHELYVKLIAALQALQANGKDLQAYLEQGFWKRTFSDVEGMDADKLKKIGDDLKRVGEALKPYVDPYVKQVTGSGTDLGKN